MQPCEGAQILAWVGSEVILAGDVLPSVNEVLLHHQHRIPPEQLDAQRLMLIRQYLNSLIETKLIYTDAKRSIPAENLPKFEDSVGRKFEEEELKKLMKAADVASRRELEAKLRGLGSSVERKKSAYVQRVLAQEWMRQQVKFDDEITHQQMLAWYEEHSAEFDRPARAQWEELAVRIAKYRSKAEANAALAHMGNQVLGGAPFAEVAKAGSDGSTAAEGGRRDWTSQGSLASEVLDRAVFGMPVGQLSQILESETSLHIIRVTKREPARRIPFAEVQKEIRDKIRQERTKRQIQEYVTKLKQRVPVWTVFDAPHQVPTVGRVP